MTPASNTVTSSVSAGTEVWAVEGVAHSILYYLDASSISAFVNIIQATTKLREYLQDSELWAKLSELHFGGLRDPALRVERCSTQSRSWSVGNRKLAEQSFREGLANGAGWLPVGSAVVTPGFDTGVEKLIHCVGPSVGTVNCYELLSQTYTSVLNCAVNENLQCIAMVSISTGNLGVPCVKGAQVALRTLQKFLVTSHWEGKLAVVCNDTSVMQAFTDEKTVLLKGFNIVPPLPATEAAGRWFS
ncbi:Adipocyte plasma membrane-associated protein [Phytophthora nicotianae]|uniref:Adipocyte plasma membrane-associated protein n=1 Tax=Phytophthora nicotianae TaxID=4792 RepID=A0A0W8CX07_PHYNI|nr:Adipocyte plasma membrane-associated protein [Phytophthora nicotianae]